jgi:hypothetical protein
MKTKIENPKPLNKVRFVTMTLLLVCLSLTVSAQENSSKQTLFRSGIEVTELWVPEVKINSIDGNIGSLVGFYGGALFNRSILLGISGGVNLTNPRVNYGYFGVIGQYIYKPGSLVHLSGQLLLASGTTKDYEDPKSSLFDNFWNISGANFYIIEPGINLEINLSRKITFVTGISYRYVTGLDETNENVSITHISNIGLSGININVGLKFGKERKPK